MFRIKICGITRTDDAALAAAAGADAIGLNFYAKSKRYCEPARAREIAAALPVGICKVGVFVNATAAEIRRIHDETPLDAVQLHGDETPEFLRALRPLPIIRAYRVTDSLAAIGGDLRTCHQLRALPRMLLVDAVAPGEYGGTGHLAPWNVIAKERQLLGGMPLVLAGGLTPENVAEAIVACRPWAVDVASGVESSPGLKSTELVRQFVEAARAALAQVSGRHAVPER